MVGTGITVETPMPGVYRLKDVWGVYSTLVVGTQQALLADTGTGVCDMAGAVRSITSLPLTVVNTHGHCDHLGGNYQFPRVFLSELDWENAKMNVIEPVKRRVLELVPPQARPEGFDEQAYLASSLAETVPLPDGAVFDLGGERVSVVPLGNHTKGSVGLLCQEKRLLLTGDAVAPFTCLHLPAACSLAEHAAMLERLLADQRFDTMLCAHSGELMDRSVLPLHLSCARHAAEAKTKSKFVDPLFPQYVGLSYVEFAQQGQADCAIVSFDPEREKTLRV